MAGTYDNKYPAYSVRKYRNPETIRDEELLDDFMLFLSMDSENEPTKEEIAKIKAWIVEYLGYTNEKVEFGERHMLQKWINNVK